jgi:hypothetical protein
MIIKMKLYHNSILFSISFLLFQLFAFSQKQEIVQLKGMVINSKFEPIPFAHIIVKNRNHGTISDESGKFDFFLEKGDIIQFSCIGFKNSIYTIPINSKFKIYHLLAVLQLDTLNLHEVKVFAWKNYKEFEQEFVKIKLPDDDIVRAEKNFELLQLQMVVNEDEIPSAPGAAYNLSMQQNYSQLYWKGQTQPMQIFNVFAWQQFFDYLKKGKFKRNKKPKN